MSASADARYRAAYADLRSREGRGSGGVDELRALPYLTQGPMAQQWSVRARTFDAFVAHIVVPLERERRRPLRILDLGAGNGWLCARMIARGHYAVAVDIRIDDVDGLAAARPYESLLQRMFGCIAGSFEQLPIQPQLFDIVVFNAALHYARNLEATLAESVRALGHGGRVAILDSPFYRREEAGEAMAKEKRESTRRNFPDLAEALLAVPSIEFLTAKTLGDAARPLGLSFRRHRVLYPLWYEVRPFVALMRGRRAPSRFDLWEARLP